jgi:integrase
VRGGELAESTYCRVWRKARVQALTEAEAASPLAGRPYDLRHAAVSTWLNAGVPSTQVTEWAGHSLAVILQIYAKCLVGQEEAARRRIDAVLGPMPETSVRIRYSHLAKPVSAGHGRTGHDRQTRQSRAR